MRHHTVETHCNLCGNAGMCKRYFVEAGKYFSLCDLCMSRELTQLLGDIRKAAYNRLKVR